MGDPFDQWEDEFDDSERASIDRVTRELEDRERNAGQSSGNAAQWVNVPTRRLQRPWRKKR
jgi:hypothetical protein